MGWSIEMHRRPLKDFLKDRTAGWDNKDEQGVVLCKTVCITSHYCMHNPGSGVLFKVMEKQRMAPDGITVVERERWIGVDLIKFYGGRSRPDGWGYKDMEASMGPTAHGCPLLYVEQLVPEPQPCPKGRCFTSTYAEDAAGKKHGDSCKMCHGCGRCWEKDWRDQVRDYHRTAKRQRAFLKNLKPGDVIVIKKGWQGAGDHETVQEVYPKRRKVRAGGWLISSKAIDIEASLEAVGIDGAVAG